ncbi:MAG: hypothetical protein KF774_01300 [Planctomyces sp.]|nr:hypothetical protein [Planctomyces sp.]
MARRHQQDAGFGSDSFLDVIANVVGILVILIVIVGLRVSRAPAPQALPLLAISEPDPEPAFIDPPILPELADDPPPPAPRRRTPHPPRPQPLPPARQPVDLITEADDLRRLREKLVAASDSIGRDIEARRPAAAALNSTVAGLADELQSVAADADAAEQILLRLQRESAQTARQVDVLQEQLSSMESTPPRIEELEHHMSPVARLVEGSELHFRLSGNRVSLVPVEVLALRLQENLQRHRDAIMKLERFEGTVGPFDGYKMDYLVERQGASLVEELKYGRGVVRFGVSQWTLQPTPGLVEETAREALRPGSRFARALEGASDSTSLTFWVYPDSFELHRLLQRAAHENGFEIAVRPLPRGVPITGSRNGSRSMAQ